MKSLWNRNYDIVDHILNGDLEKLAGIVEHVSEKAKTAYIPSYEEQLAMPHNEFALVLWDSKLGYLPKYACYDPELVEMNMLYLIHKMDEFPEEVVKTAGANLTCSAKKFGVDIPEALKLYESDYFINRVLDIDSIDQVKFASKITPQDEIKKYALNGRYPIHTPEHIKKAEFWFENNYPNLSIDEILEFTTNITREAKEQGVQLEKTAAEFSKLEIDKFNPDIYNHIQIRKSALKEDMEDYKETYNDILRKADEFGTVKVAFLIELLDKEAGLDAFYGGSIVDPIRTTFAIEKKAGLSFNNKVISPDDLNSLSSNSLMEIVGDKDVISGLKGPDALVVFESLPTPIKNDISNLV